MKEPESGAIIERGGAGCAEVCLCGGVENADHEKSQKVCAGVDGHWEGKAPVDLTLGIGKTSQQARSCDHARRSARIARQALPI